MLDRVREPPRCEYCDEYIVAGDAWTDDAGGAPYHMECFARMVLGSAAHHEGRCSCYVKGADEGDPPGLTKRQGAHAAVAALKRKNRWEILNGSKCCPSCGCKDFYLGPRGGASRNIMCAECGAKWNYSPPFEPQAIDNADRFYDRTRCITLDDLQEG